MNDQMTLGSLLAFNALTIFYLGPIERLINIHQRYNHRLWLLDASRK